MAISFEAPPLGTSPEVIAYLQRFLQNLNHEIDAANDISVRTEVPARPREGHIYYLSDSTTVGYYVYMKEVWYKVDLTPQSPPESATRTYV